jgi:hypothetical protein
MEALWEDGYEKQITWHELKDYIIKYIGGFRTTITDYLGRRAIPYKSRGMHGVIKHPAKKGYLEKFGFIEKISPKLVALHHERVNRAYHYVQSNIINFSLSNSADSNERIVGAVAPIDTYYTTTTYKMRERNLEVNIDKSKTEQQASLEDINISKKLKLTPLEQTILHIASDKAFKVYNGTDASYLRNRKRGNV